MKTMSVPDVTEQPASANRGWFQRRVSTFNESFRDGEVKRAGIEINIGKIKIRAGWIGGYLPSFFFRGTLFTSVKQTQLRVWRLAISYCANAPHEPQQPEK